MGIHTVKLSKVRGKKTHMESYLQQRTEDGWRHGWWVLDKHVLYRYKAIEDPRAEQTIPVLGWILVTQDLI